MKQKPIQLISLLLSINLSLYAENPVHINQTEQKSPPIIDAKSFILIDHMSHTILTEKNAEEKIEPASLTKLMTLYIIAKYMDQGRLQADDKVMISKKAWQVEGSKMFLKQGTRVSVDELIQGIIVASGNDATIAIAEHIASNEANFSKLMNETAQQLDMTNSHFTNSAGLPDEQHYSSAKDLAKLASAFWRDYPEFSQRFKQQWYTFDNIKQPNRNRLLWRDATIDGMKTGHTSTAGFCLITSANRLDSKLISIILGSSTEVNRDQASKNLLTWAERNYEHRTVFPQSIITKNPKIWYSYESKPKILNRPIHLTLQKTNTNLKIKAKYTRNLAAPLAPHAQIGEIIISNDNKIISKTPLKINQEIKSGSIFRKLKDYCHWSAHNILNKLIKTEHEDD